MVALDRDLLIDSIWHNYINKKVKMEIYGTTYDIFCGFVDGNTEIYCDSEKYRILLVIPHDEKSYLVISKHSTEEIIYQDSGEQYIPENLPELLTLN